MHTGGFKFYRSGMFPIIVFGLLMAFSFAHADEIHNGEGADSSPDPIDWGETTYSSPSDGPQTSRDIPRNIVPPKSKKTADAPGVGFQLASKIYSTAYKEKLLATPARQTSPTSNKLAATPASSPVVPTFMIPQGPLTPAAVSSAASVEVPGGKPAASVAATTLKEEESVLPIPPRPPILPAEARILASLEPTLASVGGGEPDPQDPKGNKKKAKAASKRLLKQAKRLPIILRTPPVAAKGAARVTEAKQALSLDKPAAQ